MDNLNKKIEALLKKASTGFRIAMEREDIQSYLLPYGYGNSRLQDLIDLYSETNDRYLLQKRAYAEYMKVKQELRKKFKEEQTRYMDFRKLSSQALSAPSDKQYHFFLGIEVRMARATGRFVSQAKYFYKTALTTKELLDKLAYFKITPEKLEAGLNGIEALEHLMSARIASRGYAKGATYERDAFYQKLMRAYSGFVEASKISMRDLPQLRELLGIRERSKPVRKKKTATNGA
ncbi:MAG: hypothetical protein ACM3SY_07740 [Candidatus Omnitrophota bacterium]